MKEIKDNKSLRSCPDQIQIIPPIVLRIENDTQYYYE